MSGVEPFIAAMLASAGTASTAAAGTAAATGAAAAGATGAALAGGAGALATGAGGAAAGLTTLGAIEGAAALTGIVGTAGQLLADKPEMNLNVPSAPTRDDAQREMNERDALLRKKGRGAALLTEGGASGDVSSPYLGSAQLLGA